MNLLLPEPTPGTHLDVAELTEGLAVAGPALGASPPPESLTLTEAWWLHKASGRNWVAGGRLARITASRART